MEKKIVIIWSIDEDVFNCVNGYTLKSHQGRDFQFIDFYCENNSEKKLIIIRLMSIAGMDEIKNVTNFLVEELKNISDEKLFFIHYDPPDLRKFLDPFHELSYIPFGKGHGILYVKNNPNGLFLESYYLNMDAFVNTTSYETIRLKDTVFDEIWNHFAVKKKIEKIMLDFHKRFLPVTFDISALKQMSKEKRSEYLSLMYSGYGAYHGYDPQHFHDLLADLVKLMVGIDLDQELEPLSTPGDEKNSLLSIAKHHSEGLKKMFEELFKGSDLGLTADYKRIDRGLEISDFFLGMDAFLKQIFTSNIKDLEQSTFWKNHIGPEAEKTEYYFPVWYCRLMEKLEKFYKYPKS